MVCDNILIALKAFFLCTKFRV